MRKFLLKLLGNSIYIPEPIDEKKMQDWLCMSFRDDGFKNYYTTRKRALVNLILWEDDKTKRAELQGRLRELGGLSVNITEEYQRRKNNK